MNYIDLIYRNRGRGYKTQKYITSSILISETKKHTLHANGWETN